MARAIWSGTISFGLVSVPVRMFPATQSQELRFHFVDRRDLTPIGYEKVRKDDGESVPAEEIVRGFEIDKGRYVPLEDEDLDRLDIELTHSIDICDFVDLGEIDPIYFRKAYYLAPQEGAEKPYRLLVKALEETGKVGVAKVVVRNKQHLAALRAHDGVLRGRDPAAGVREREGKTPGRRGRDGEVARAEPERYVQAGQVRRQLPQGAPAADPQEGEGAEAPGAAGRRGCRGRRPDGRSARVGRAHAEAADEEVVDEEARQEGQLAFREWPSWPSTGKSATRRRHRSRSAGRGRAGSPSSSCSGTTPVGSITTSAWSGTARSRAGRCRRGSRSSPGSARSPSTSRTTRSSTRSSRARSRRVSTVPASSRSGTAARTSCWRRRRTAGSPFVSTAIGSRVRGRSSRRSSTATRRTG